MYALCPYTCSYCRRSIETAFVTLGETHYHAMENEFGQKCGRSCYDLSEHGTKTLSGNAALAHTVENGPGTWVVSFP